MYSMNSYLFSTKIGWAAILWHKKHITKVILPHKSKKTLTEKLKNTVQKQPPNWLQRIVEQIQAHFCGELQDFSHAPLDDKNLTPFRKKVYEFTRTIPPGSVMTYGEIAEKVNSPRAYRAVGSAMSNNPFPLLVPCHRVLAAGYKVGGFSSEGGITTKATMLKIEGYQISSTNPLRSSPKILANKQAMQYLLKRDKQLAKYIQRIGNFRMEISHSSSTFASLLRSIVYQQLSGKAAASIHQKILLLYPDKKFPEAQDIIDTADQELLNAGLSRNKLKSVKDLAQKVIEGKIPSLSQLNKMSDTEIIAQLTQVRGIGEWSVQMLLMFTLKRMDILPTGDYGIRKGFAIVYNTDLPTPKQLIKYGEKWQPYRTVASWYLWRTLELEL